MPFHTKRLTFRALAALALAGLLPIVPGTTALAALPQGAKAPDFNTQAVLAGKPFPFHLSDALKRGPVVLYFFPAAFTSGCTSRRMSFLTPPMLSMPPERPL
jgi:hypothetical protein